MYFCGFTWNMAKTGGKRHVIDPVVGKATQFTSDKQPEGKVKSAGWQKKRFTRQIIREFLEGKFNLSPELKKQFEAKFGIDPDNITVGAAALMQQAMLAMGNGTIAKQAAEFLFNQAYGQPKQEIEHSGEIQGPVINNIVIENPNQGNKDKADPSAV